MTIQVQMDDNFITAIVSSTHRFQGDIWSIKVGINDFSNSTINIPGINGPKADRIFTPSHCWYISLLKVKCPIFVHKSKSPVISLLIIFVYSSLSSYVLLSIMLIV